MRTPVVILVLLVLVTGGTAWYYWDAHSKIETEVQSLREAHDELTFEVEKLKNEKALVTHELEKKIASISRAKEEEVGNVKSTYEDLVANMKNEIEQGQIKITQLADRLSVSLVDRILFSSGEAVISPEGIKVLERVGSSLKNTQGKVIRVEGHTDTVAITGRLQKQFPTNWELSTARATNVVRFFQERVGIASTRLQAVGLAEFHPVASNATADGRSQNRRIEIALLPEVSIGSVTEKK